MAFIVELREPLKGVSQLTGEQVLCIGIAAMDVGGQEELVWLVVEGTDGRPAREPYNGVRIDWRFDTKAQAWINVGVGVEAGDDDPG